jgi:hypothetical protein
VEALERRMHDRQQKGNGRGSDYRPWIDVRTGSTQGEANRTWSRAAGRVCHFLSRLEYHVFLIFDYDGKTTDIREQFPLLPMGETRDIARDLGVAHPRGPGREMSYRVLTTDLVVTRSEEGGVQDFAYAIKPTRRGRHAGQRNRLAVERAYWERREVPWDIIAGDELPAVLLSNLLWLEGVRFRRWDEFDPPVDPSDAPAVFEILSRSHEPLARACRMADGRLARPPGTALTITRYSLALGHWEADLTARRYPDEPLAGLAWAAAQDG